MRLQDFFLCIHGSLHFEDNVVGQIELQAHQGFLGLVITTHFVGGCSSLFLGAGCLPHVAQVAQRLDGNSIVGQDAVTNGRAVGKRNVVSEYLRQQHEAIQTIPLARPFLSKLFVGVYCFGGDFGIGRDTVRQR